MKSRISAKFWQFGAYPVVAAAAFQLVIVYRTRADLAEFFLIQSVVALGLSVACLQPRTWRMDQKTTARLRWSMLLSVAFLMGCAVWMVAIPPALGMLVLVFLAKKLCDIGREYFFISTSDVPKVTSSIVTGAELVGLACLLVGSIPLAIVAYLSAGLLLLAVAMRAAVGESWEIRWIAGEVPHALRMTLFNMGSRLFLVSVASGAAHLNIGSLLQVVNFVSPITYAVNSRSRGRLAIIAGFAVCSSAILFGSAAFVYIGGVSAVPWGSLILYALLLAFNGAAVIRLSVSAGVRERARLGWVVALWTVACSLLGYGEWIPWNTSYTVLLAGTSAILLTFGYRMWRERRS